MLSDVKKSTKEGSVKESDIEENSELAEIDLAHTTYESDSQTSLTSESLKSNVSCFDIVTLNKLNKIY